MPQLSSCAFAPIATCLLATGAYADLNYGDFSLPAGVQLLGDAHLAGTQLRLTNDAQDEAGAAWFTSAQKVSTAWAAEFDFRIGGGQGADGFAFVIQNDATTAIAGAGCELGYDGIPNSVAIEFDTYTNGSCNAGTVNDLGVPHISVHTNGTAPNSVQETASIGATTIVPAFADGGVHTARVLYVPGTLFVYVDDLVNPLLSVPLDLTTTLALTGERAWVGFTGATGGLSEAHDVLNFVFDEDTVGGGSNTSPAQPSVTEPHADGVTVNPADVHMESTPFADPDPGDQHFCTEYEIWRISTVTRVWTTGCITGVTKLHAHLADGAFEGTHSGFTELLPGAQYLLRIRHRDDSGASLTEWSPWAQRFFTTGTASDTFPLVTEDIAAAPAPRWVDADTRQAVVLSDGPTPPSLRLESAGGALLLDLAGQSGVGNLVTNPPALTDHVEVRAVLSGGSTGLTLPTTDLVVHDHDCLRFEILLPAISLPAGQSRYLWITRTGSTFIGTANQVQPNFNTLARGLDLPWSTRQPGYEVEVFAEGLTLPVNLAFLPNAAAAPDAPFLYVTELYGDIKVVARDGSVGTFASGLIDFNPTGNFPGSGEQGLTGIAVDPQSGDVFASLLYDSPSSPGTHYPKVVRFTSTDGGRTAATQTTILDFVGEPQGQSHQISNLSIHPDGKLLVHMGDGFVASTAQDLGSFRGKILRVNLDGSPAADNPFFNAGDGIAPIDYVFAYGVRNPFGGDWRAADGQHYAVENGPAIDRLTKVTSGRNFLWNGTNGSMVNHALYVWNPANGPVNLAFVQPETFGGSGFPMDKQGHAFVTESGPTYGTGSQAKGKRISEFVLDANGVVVSGPIPFLEYAGQGKETAVGLAAGPDGLYVTSLYRDEGFNPTATGARIYRVRRELGWDCNGNGIDDECDIAAGVEQDLDGNGLPDACDCGGVRSCDASVNSTGAAATIASNGQCAVSSNQFVLTSSSVPSGLGLFFFSGGLLNHGQGVPFFNGVRCVGPAISRLPVVQSAGGVAQTAVDFTTGPAAQIQPGQTWHFQYWYRDLAGGGTQVNVSEALTVAFQ